MSFGQEFAKSDWFFQGGFLAPTPVKVARARRLRLKRPPQLSLVRASRVRLCVCAFVHVAFVLSLACVSSRAVSVSVKTSHSQTHPALARFRAFKVLAGRKRLTSRC